MGYVICFVSGAMVAIFAIALCTAASDKNDED